MIFRVVFVGDLTCLPLSTPDLQRVSEFGPSAWIFPPVDSRVVSAAYKRPRVSCFSRSLLTVPFLSPSLEFFCIPIPPPLFSHDTPFPPGGASLFTIDPFPKGDTLGFPTEVFVFALGLSTTHLLRAFCLPQSTRAAPYGISPPICTFKPVSRGPPPPPSSQFFPSRSKTPWNTSPSCLATLDYCMQCDTCPNVSIYLYHLPPAAYS